MSSIKTLKPLLNPIILSKPCLNLLTPHKLFSTSTQDLNFTTKNKIPLDDLFKQSLGLTEKTDVMGFEIDENGAENTEVKKSLYGLEMEVRKLKDGSEEKRSKFVGKVVGSGSNSKRKCLVDFFEKKEKDGLVLKDITKDMEMLLKHLYELGYFKGGNFMAKDGFDVGCFDSFYARDFVKCAVEKFGSDNQHITKWLSGSDLKTLAIFGCPSQEKREVFAAKRLRLFFEIPEETVCSKCSLKESCKFVNQSIWGLQNKNLRLDLLMRLLKTYAMKDVPAQLELTQEFEACVSRLMHEIINLTKSSR